MNLLIRAATVFIWPIEILVWTMAFLGHKPKVVDIGWKEIERWGEEDNDEE